MRQDFTTILMEFEKKVIPLARESNIAYFDATISGKDEDFRRVADLEVKMSKIYADKTTFAKLREIRASGHIVDALLKRQLDLLYLAFLEKQLDEHRLEAIIRLQNKLENAFTTFRAKVNGKSYTDNEIDQTLRSSLDENELRTVWTASKDIGQHVAHDVIRLVKLRNSAARELGFANYHSMKLELEEQDPEEIARLFDELDGLTCDAFAQLKREMDAILAAKYNCSVEQLMPWHYQNRFFQQAPAIYDVDLDAFYRSENLVELAVRYFAGLNLPIDDLIERSDLFEKEGKYQHAYCTDIDREGDVRVVCNIVPTHGWMNTMLHEYGHAVYDKFNDRTLPWLLREPSHTFTTEAIAMLFGRQAANPRWLRSIAGIPAEESNKLTEQLRKSLRLEQLVFSRWVQVMYRFETSLYQQPDQDLDTLWWKLVGRYQMIRRPEGRPAPDWASKIHIALYPAYYHNYMMGELLASQLHHYICTEVIRHGDTANESYAGRSDVGVWLRDKVFSVGRSVHWKDMITSAVGEALTPKYYARQFVEQPML